MPPFSAFFLFFLTLAYYRPIANTIHIQLRQVIYIPQLYS